jgi:hypothetical protein
VFAEHPARGAHPAGLAAILVGMAALGLGLARGWTVVEGADVLLARDGVAPVELSWIDALELQARPPEYLHQGETVASSGATALLVRAPVPFPHGTVVTLRGRPLRPGRRLLLSDGSVEVPFEDDGSGGVVARWELATTVTLHVVARFGDVVIREPQGVPLVSVPDLAPVVALEGAPRRLVLAEQTEDVPIRYKATDDHGLREVRLALRSGVREDKRVVARLDGETKLNAGGLNLRLRDSFLQKCHAPVEVTVEARDDDPEKGSSWGRSAPITIIPPAVGEPQVRLLEGLRGLRDELVDALAWRLAASVPAAGPARVSFLAADAHQSEASSRTLDRLSTQGYAGVYLPGRLRALLVAQRQATRAALDQEAKTPTAAAHARVVEASERSVLVADAVVRGLGQRDATEAARLLSDVADDLATGLSQLQKDDADTQTRGAARSDAATTVLGEGAAQMLSMGDLGRDIGEIVVADVGRVKRARGDDDLVHAELAARDLAARLHQPDPSFGSSGGRGRAGGESGSPGGGAGGGEVGAPDDVEQAFDVAARDLEELSRDHAGQVARSERALAGATSDAEMNAMREEARNHAAAMRDAARSLPQVGRGASSWSSKAATARELAEQAAQSLEGGRLEEASESGRGSLGSLESSSKALSDQPGDDARRAGDQRRVEEARRRLAAEQAWMEQALRDLRARASDRARDQLGQAGADEEKMAERARELAQRGKGALPDEAVESIADAERDAREAAEALRRGQGDRGLEKQRDAQRDLETARSQMQDDRDGDESPRSPGATASDKGSPGGDVDIPDATKHRGPEDFRLRVERGLAMPRSGALRDAVQRYAEGLLR